MEGDVPSLRLLIRSHISIHTLRMEGDQATTNRQMTPKEISIHTLRMEGDLIGPDCIGTGIEDFNPHPPHGG